MISTGASNETNISGALAGSAKTTKDRLVDSSPTELIRPRVSQGVISGKGEARTADPLPYSMARALGLNKSSSNGWQIVRRNGILYAQRGNHEINLTTTSWQSRNPHANLWLRFWFAADDSTFRCTPTP